MGVGKGGRCSTSVLSTVSMHICYMNIDRDERFMSSVVFTCFSASFLETGFLFSLKLMALQVAGIKVKASYVQDLLRSPSLEEKPLFVKPHNF